MSDPVADTAIPELSAQDRLNAMTPADRASWDLTGEWPEPAKVTTTADVDDDEPEPVPSPAPTPEPVGEPTSSAPAEAAALATERRTGKVTRQQQINDLIRKTTESDLRARALEAEIQALKAGKTAPVETKPEPKADDFQPTRPRPTEADFESYADFTEALADWKFDQREAKSAFEADKTRRAQSEATRRQEFQERASTWIERRDTFAAASPDFVTKAMPFLDGVHSGTPIGDVLLESEVGPQMALYLATHPDEADRIARLAPISALRALGKLEAKFDSDITTSTSASAGPAANTQTKAPAPPTTLAARSASPADPAAAALARGDYVAWEAEENRKALAANR